MGRVSSGIIALAIFGGFLCGCTAFLPIDYLISRYAISRKKKKWKENPPKPIEILKTISTLIHKGAEHVKGENTEGDTFEYDRLHTKFKYYDFNQKHSQYFQQKLVQNFIKGNLAKRIQNIVMEYVNDKFIFYVGPRIKSCTADSRWTSPERRLYEQYNKNDKIILYHVDGISGSRLDESDFLRQELKESRYSVCRQCMHDIHGNDSHNYYDCIIRYVV
eukprot:260821_1